MSAIEDARKAALAKAHAASPGMPADFFAYREPTQSSARAPAPQFSAAEIAGGAANNAQLEIEAQRRADMDARSRAERASHDQP